MGLLSSPPPEMRSLLLLVGLLATLALAQRPGRPGSGGRPSPCSDGGRPACADGSRPERPPRGQRGPPTCSTPSCGGASPVCPDGSPLNTESRRPCTGGRPVCADASISPLCEDGSEPGRGGRGSGGRPGRG